MIEASNLDVHCSSSLIRESTTAEEVFVVKGNELKYKQSREYAIQVLSQWAVGEVITDENGFYLVYQNTQSLQRIKGTAREVFVSDAEQLIVTRENGSICDVVVCDATPYQ
ncbi:MAG: hypothetical protein CMF12_05985 [Idiomarina sp.]|uniref:hypothetical protein n=1 Tax=Idiomarina sp. TaxID=1874361 RepID=UPI000C62E732|nr:hypothetical protein [Idiomarina sp.]MBT42056.1 hypothetical protein [Idiomarina sp.]